MNEHSAQQPHKKIAGLILGGGQSRRMGRDKTWVSVHGQTLLALAYQRLKQQLACVALNTPRLSVSEQQALAQRLLHESELSELTVVPDQIDGFLGPLAGVHAGMSYFAKQGYTHLITISIDAPFFPVDLVARLSEQNCDYACARSDQRSHPVFALWPCSAHQALSAALEQGLRRVDAFTANTGLVQVDWPHQPYDPFFNINNPSELEQAEQMIQQGLVQLLKS